MSESSRWNSDIDILQDLQVHHDDDDLMSYIDSGLITTEDLQRSSQPSVVETVSPNELTVSLGFGNPHSHVNIVSLAWSWNAQFHYVRKRIRTFTP
ncbi:hypothetical protein BN14_10744 [Rhizoctonia solani AG-1 IB]|uniref:Uncharacterized protein n=1 Tax=Thanatephorus cucumeris (strain AG1-IB / isolate 7/3/14) TaxID=1108050 RepID=M5C9D0_THACB|nr:hypothetical protein BN14_10744 [Rhizoctonia solani AG-1 IB]